MKSIRNQKGLSMVVLLLSVVIVLVLATVVLKKMYSGTDKALQTSGAAGKVHSPADVKNKAMGSACSQTIQMFGVAAENYRASNGDIPQSISQITEISPELGASINDTNLWVKDGEPRYEASGGSYVIDGYCVDGNVYTYNSGAGAVTSKPY